jgi:ribonuclease P protein component
MLFDRRLDRDADPNSSLEVAPLEARELYPRVGTRGKAKIPIRCRLLDFSHTSDVIHVSSSRRGLDREAYLSAKDPSPRARSRMSRAHEDDGRPQGPRCAASARSQAPHRRLRQAVMHAARLRRGEDIARVRAEGVARNDKLFSLRALPNDLPTVRVAVAASRAVGGAVKRNRARRRLREAVRLSLARRSAAQGVDLVLMVRAAALGAASVDVRSAVERQLDAVLQ